VIKPEGAAAQLCAAPDLEPQVAASQVLYNFACGSKPVSLNPLGVPCVGEDRGGARER